VNRPPYARALSGRGELLGSFDADDRGDAGSFEFAPGVAEELLHGTDVEAAAHLVGPRDGEARAGGGEEAAGFEFVLQRFDFRFGALEKRVGMADRVGERLVRKIVESIMMLGSLGHGFAPVAWVRAARVLPTPWRPDFSVLSRFL
jgi:hypothetical protein